MNVRALQLFKDKNEGVIRKKGDTFIVNEERFEEINSAGHGKMVENFEEVDEISVEDLTVKQIKELLDQMGVKYNSKMKRDELIALIEAGD